MIGNIWQTYMRIGGKFLALISVLCYLCCFKVLSDQLCNYKNPTCLDQYCHPLVKRILLTKGLSVAVVSLFNPSLFVSFLWVLLLVFPWYMAIIKDTLDEAFYFLFHL